jgi:hypothetical protein
MRNDEKIRAVRKRFGHIGYSVWCMTLEKLTDSEGFSATENPLELEFQAADFDIDIQKLKEIWDYFVEIGILQRDNINGNTSSKLYSRHLIQRFEGLIANRNRDRKDFSQRKQHIIGEHIIGEDTRAEQSRAEENPPAAASFLSLLKTRLDAAPILLSPADFERIAAQLIGQGGDNEQFLNWALVKASTARKPSVVFTRGLLEWDWVAQWKAGNGTAAPESASYQPPAPYLSTPEDDAAVALEAARTKQRMKMPLTDEEKKLLGLAMGPPEEKEVDDFPADFPEVPA